jgi:hypothetical protein
MTDEPAQPTEPQPPPLAKRQWSTRAKIVAAVVIIVIGLAVYGVIRGPAPTPGTGSHPTRPLAASPTVGKYTQTWTIAYTDTTCTQWTAQMNDHQRFVMAGDMLLAAHQQDKPGAPIPPDVQINTFKDGIGTICEDAGPVKVTEIGATLYTMADDLKPAP